MPILHAPPGIDNVTRGEAHSERHYLVNRDGTLDVPENEVADFLAMGFTRETQRIERPAPPTLPAAARPATVSRVS
jgi:hypothetical protein